MRKVPNLNEFKPAPNTAARAPTHAFPNVSAGKAHNTGEDAICNEPQSHPHNLRPRRLCLRGLERFASFFHLYLHVLTSDTTQAVSHLNQDLNCSCLRGLPQQRWHKLRCCCLGLRLYRRMRHLQVLTEPPSSALCQPYATSRQNPTKL